MKYALIILLLLPSIVIAQDVMVFNSGKEFTCEILSYSEGSFSVKLPDGAIKQASTRRVKEITFAPNATPLETASAKTTQVPTTPIKEGFRSTKWGMSTKEVAETEQNKPLKEDDDALMYEDNISGIDAYILYFFVQDRLVRAKYIFVDKHTNKNDFIADYKTLKRVLTEKYGSPYDDNVVWKNDLYKGDTSEWGFAVSLGQLAYVEKWETPETTIYHLLYGENYEISHVVEYSSKALEDLEESKKKQADLNKL